MEKQYSVLEAAQALGKSKNTLKYQVRKLPQECVCKDENGRIWITEAGLDLLRQRLSIRPDEKPDETTNKPLRTGQKPDENDLEPDEKPDQKPHKPDEEPPAEAALIAVYREQIADLREQLIAKDRQIEQLAGQLDRITVALESTTAALAAAQALHAATMQQAALTVSAEPKSDEEPSAEAELDKPRKGFLSRLFKRGGGSANSAPRI